MTNRVRFLRAGLAAAVALVLATSAVLAADPQGPKAESRGALVSRAAHLTAPAGFRNHGRFVSCVARMADPAPDFDPATLQPDDCEPDETEAAEEVETTSGSDGHGSLVSQAAAMDTPAGFDNHGAFVSCVARMNRGQLGPEADSSALDLAALTPAECERDGGKPSKLEAAPQSEDAPKGNAKGRDPDKKSSATGRGKRG